MESNKNSLEANSEMCGFCFESLVNHLEGKGQKEYPKSLPSSSAPLFVTWHTTGDELRGCIGTFTSEPLSKNLSQYALISALQDSRFPPITSQELSSLSVAVSLLVNFDKDALHPLDWQVGKHGIIISFKHKGRNYQATFLPEVAAEQEWNQQQTVDYLIKKAGYQGTYESIKDKIQLERYQSSKSILSYQEWKSK